MLANNSTPTTTSGSATTQYSGKGTHGSSGGGAVISVSTTDTTANSNLETEGTDSKVADENKGNVLGETCEVLVTKDLVIGKKNNADEVKKLQTFLNARMGSKLPVTGHFGTMTKAEVKNFQKKYKDDILTPLKLKNPTGHVYKATRAKVNALSCATK
jgi:peptidoglycan hydrolase-like protein with peptidoglycan-binding domain